MTPSDAERRQVVLDKYEKGQSTASDKPPEQNAVVKGN
jgi:type IV pilus biogenesis protein CpaD/CtpE